MANYAFSVVLTGLVFVTGCATPPTPEAANATPVAAAVPPTPGTPTPPVGLRLPETVKALAQRVELTIVPSSDTFEGTTELDVELTSATEVVWLNVRALTVKKASARVGEVETSAQLSTLPERVALRFPAPLGPGRATLRLTFTGVISGTETAGIFHQQEGGDWYAMTQFEATDARRAFPCVDEPSAKVPWELTLRVPKDLTAVSNTPILKEDPRGEGMKSVHFRRTKAPAVLPGSVRRRSL